MRKSNYFITINKKKEKEIISIEELSEILIEFKYFGILHDKESNPHYHIYLHKEHGTTFEKVKSLLPDAHLEQLKGTKKQVYEYLLHENEEEKNKYEEKDIFTNIENLNEYINRQVTLERKLLELIECDTPTWVIVKKYPQLIYRINTIEQLRVIYQTEELKEEC